VNRRAIARGMRPNRHPLDEDSASRLLQGTVHPDDAPPGYGSVAGLLASASVLPTVDEDAAAITVSAMVEAIRGGVSTPQTSRRKSMLSKLLAGKALAAIGVIALTASGAAAATGSLPDPAQGVVAGAVSHVGIHIPQPGDQGNSAGHRQDGTNGQGGAHRPDETTPTSAGSDNTSGDNHGSLVSGTAHDAKQNNLPVGPTVCVVASGGQCKVGADHNGQGSGDEGTTNSTVGSDDHSGQSVSDEPAEHDASDDHGEVVAPPTTATTGSSATGEDHSGGAADKGGSESSGRH
jgi:hypothetical protein